MSCQHVGPAFILFSKPASSLCLAKSEPLMAKRREFGMNAAVQKDSVE